MSSINHEDGLDSQNVNHAAEPSRPVHAPRPAGGVHGPTPCGPSSEGQKVKHLNVYPLIARSAYGFMVQVLGGLITYLLLALYCRKYFQERVSIKRVRELGINIPKDPRIGDIYLPERWQQKNYARAKT